MLESVPCPWWVCGGWAIDLWLGRETRRHGDTDIGCFRAGVDRLCAALPDWECYSAEDGALSPYPSPDVAPISVSSLWCRRRTATSWDLQVMIEDAESGRWLFRRDTRVTRPVEEITWLTDTGIRVLAPEIQLLYKAKGVRPSDQADFDASLSTLSESARGWLVQALETVHPHHPWIGHLVGE